VAEVKGMTILLKQVDAPNPTGGLQLLLHPDGFVFVGETMSIVTLPTSFQVCVRERESKRARERNCERARERESERAR